jgi:hypothetical protein
MSQDIISIAAEAWNHTFIIFNQYEVKQIFNTTTDSSPRISSACLWYEKRWYNHKSLTDTPPVTSLKVVWADL